MKAWRVLRLAINDASSTGEFAFIRYMDNKMAKLRAECNNYLQFLHLVKRVGFIITDEKIFKEKYWDRFVTRK